MKNDITMQVPIDKKTNDFIKKEADKNQRTKQGQVRYWLGKIVSGEWK